MAIYRYEGQQRGRSVTGFLSHDNRREAKKALRKGRIRVAKLVEYAETENTEDTSLQKRPIWEKKLLGVLVRKIDAERAFHQISSLLRSGVPIMKAMHLAAQLSPRFMKRSLYCAANRLSGGASLQQAMQQEMPFLDRVSLNLIAVGEANGTLQEMFSYASNLMEQRRKIKGNILQALSYPALVVVATGGAIWFLREKVFPKVMKFLTARDAELPQITQWLVNSADFLEVWGGWVLSSPFILAFLIFLSRRSVSIARAQDSLLLRVPFFGKIAAAAANVMWCRTLGILVASGINIMQALRLTGDTLSNQFLRRQFSWIEQLVQQGHALSLGIRITAVSTFCPLAESMVKIGESAGLIDENLKEIASFYQDDLDRRLTFLSKMIEPALFVVVGGVVAFVYIGFFMGIMALSQRGG
ncbi:MAG: type II secretion system F family protein [Verrucomicrobiota bacterium]